jgi:hypothetical protein
MRGGCEIVESAAIYAGVTDISWHNKVHRSFSQYRDDGDGGRNGMCWMKVYAQ